MRKFGIYSNDQLIAWTRLEHFEPPAHAGGKFIPTGDYAKLKDEIVATCGVANQDFLNLSLKTEQGEPLGVLHIYLMDQPHIYGEDIGYEMVVGGFVNPSYCTLFKDECEKKLTKVTTPKSPVLIVNLDRRDE
ncbi:MAG TPA: hypothetical protein PLI96_03745 [Halothiobacillus sp.]|nr:hypothetical protein [Halothiobacillus sp.]